MSALEELPVIQPGAAKPPRPWFQFRIWMLFFTLGYFAILFAVIRPRGPQGPIPECHIRIQNDDDALSRHYDVVFLDGSRECYLSRWFGSEERLVGVEVRRGNGAKAYWMDGSGFQMPAVPEHMFGVFEEIKKLAQARAENPKTMNPPVYDEERRRVRFERGVPRITTAYLFEDPPHAEAPSGP